MSKENLIGLMFKNKLMRTNEEIACFEDSLFEYQDKEYDYTEELFKCFDDNTSENSVMWGLLHYIDNEEGEQSVERIIDNINIFFENNGIEWLELLIRRILNHNDYKNIFIEKYKKTTNLENKKKIDIILEIIRNDS